MSSSLHDLARHLRSFGVILDPDLPVLRSLGVRQALTAQLNSTHTILRGVTLVPSFCTVRIDDGVPSVSTLPQLHAPSEYEDALGQHIHTWRSRFTTLIGDPRTTFVTDLSGGLDSRVVFAFAHASGLFTDTHARVQIASQERMPEDFAAAKGIAQQYEVELNGTPKPMRTATNPERALESWMHHSLGVYMPVYLSPHEFDALSVRCHGGGGGTFRDIFTGTSLRDRLLSTRKNFSDDMFEQYSSTVLGDLDSLCKLRPEVDPQKLHYREFRNRFHFGHAPQTRTTFSPLNSILIDAIADRPEADDRGTYFDMMDCLAPGLKNAPYDDPTKSPDHSALSDVAHRMDLTEPEPGRIFAELHEGVADKRDQRRSFALFYDLAQEAIQKPEVQDVIGDSRVVTRTRRFLKEVREQSGRPRANAPGHQDASYALTAALAAGVPLEV